MIIGISGKARSGKDTFAEMLAGQLNRDARPQYVLMAFANELKSKCQKDFDLSWEQLWGEEKEVPDKRYLKPIRCENDPEPHWTAREIMQEYGAFFRSIDHHFWIKNLFRVAEEKEYSNIIITDVRYINEADYILEKGGYVLRVERENKDDVHNMSHPSEVELDNYRKFDFVVLNNFGLEELKVAAEETVDFLRQNEINFKKLKEIKIDG